MTRMAPPSVTREVEDTTPAQAGVTQHAQAGRRGGTSTRMGRNYAT